MPETTDGKCKLCCETGTILNSHIVPNFILKILKDNQKNNYALLPTLLTAESPDKPVQQAMRYFLLCGECEGKFSKWEKLFAPDYKRLIEDDVPFPVDYFKQDWTLRLALSFAWRASQSFLIEAGSLFRAEDISIIQECCDFWSQFLLDERKTYDAARPTWWQTKYLDVEPSDDAGLAEIAAQPDGLDSYIARYCDYLLGPASAGTFVWYKIPFLVVTIAVEPRTADCKITAREYENILHTRTRITKQHMDANTSEEQRQQRTDAILKNTTQNQRDAFYASRFGESSILDKQRAELKEKLSQKTKPE